MKLFLGRYTSFEHFKQVIFDLSNLRFASSFSRQAFTGAKMRVSLAVDISTILFDAFKIVRCIVRSKGHKGIIFCCELRKYNLTV